MKKTFVERNEELSNFKTAAFRFWDRFGGNIDELFINVFPISINNYIDNIILRKWLLEWHGGFNVVKEEINRILSRKTNIREHNDDIYYGSYDFYFKADKGIRFNSDDEFHGTVAFVDVIVDSNGVLMYINDFDNESIYQIRDVLNSEDNLVIEQEIKDVLNDWFRLNIINKYGVFLYVDKIKFE